MADKKENDPSSIGGPTAGASTASATSDSKMSKPTVNMKIQGSVHYDASKELDDVVMGGCSTCGSLQHDTFECDHEDQPEYMMSGALQTEVDSSTSASATASSTATPAEKGGQAQSDMPSSQDVGRRRSV